MTSTRRKSQIPITAAPDIRAASRVSSTGPIPRPAGAEADTAEAAPTPAPESPSQRGASQTATAAQASVPQASTAQAQPLQAPALQASGPQWTSGTQSETVPVTHGGRTYKVRQGDTLYAVASRHGVSVPALAELNRISPRQNLSQGQVLSLPEKNDLPDTDPSHVVAPGETLNGIAATHGISPGTLRRANALGDDSLIRVGELLLLRDGAARPRRHAPDVPEALPQVAGAEGIRPSVVRAARLNKATLLARTHPTPEQARFLVAQIAEELGADPALMQAVAAQESGFQHATVSAGNAIGIMQVTPRSGRWASDIVGRSLDLLDIADNIVAGTVILGWLVETAESETEALAGYYQDLRTVREDGLLPETKAFVRAVQMQRGRWEEAR
ncbi:MULTISPECIES: LysM peptidoglycan-binding domain-containing protein [unclassified Brevibacterium]|uniref:lytic transglycosylase n=1 Tax=unclassified Brevibacterium TaxID=2614124 RepID=UPI0020172F66|nr:MULTISPECIES: LysM peptidoglycan-binding domain-containing protein [unclassified Brevibacterium]MCM1012699.1 LysM peptidoglycan-binding domain-containing protein [Brevibacterium sp. XM4083]